MELESVLALLEGYAEVVAPQWSLPYIKTCKGD